ncbi:MAG: EamA family transporter RarD [Methylibium sp.]|uniref:EamA family transporter RarD n=1 Tax=Methylibium sp. TaxID=2067992 RepID=UPI00178F7B98|nr:EamA family transporter RarD [Methylibium sp.]MBA3596050.1 EamA family transporter RarD [Methylibium sp.]
MNRGILQASLAYACWGLFPLYFKALQAVPPLELLAHRVTWSLLFVAALLAAQRRWTWLGAALRDPRVLRSCAASSLLIAINWFFYIWAVSSDRIVEASLGYFINPLVNVLFAALVLGERLRRGQWVAVALAAAGVAWLTVQAGAPPWIALAIAVSFAGYGLLRKTAPLGALEGLAMETLMLGPIALAVLAWLALQGQAAFTDSGGATRWLLIAAGPITAIPLLLFAAGARRIPFALLGLLQYIGPTLQLLLGVLIFDERFDARRAIGFGAIWAALALYSAESLWRSRRSGARA